MEKIKNFIENISSKHIFFAFLTLWIIAYGFAVEQNSREKKSYLECKTKCHPYQLELLESECWCYSGKDQIERVDVK